MRWHNVQFTVEMLTSDNAEHIGEDITAETIDKAREQLAAVLKQSPVWAQIVGRANVVYSVVENERGTNGK